MASVNTQIKTKDNPYTCNDEQREPVYIKTKKKNGCEKQIEEKVKFEELDKEEMKVEIKEENLSDDELKWSEINDISEEEMSVLAKNRLQPLKNDVVDEAKQDTQQAENNQHPSMIDQEEMQNTTPVNCDIEDSWEVKLFSDDLALTSVDKAMDTPKMVRVSPISGPEKELLILLIRAESAIRDRRTDGRTILQKREAWAKVTRNFNSRNIGPARSEQQLKKSWERLKVKVKHDDAHNKWEIKRTGGGGPPIPVSQESNEVLAILGKDMEHIGNPYDLDEMPLPECSYSEVVELVHIGPVPEDVTMTDEQPEGPSQASPPATPGQTAPAVSSGRRRKHRFQEVVLKDQEGKRQLLEKRKEQLFEQQMKDLKNRNEEGEVRLQEAHLLREVAQIKLEKEKKLMRIAEMQLEREEILKRQAEKLQRDNKSVN